MSEASSQAPVASLEVFTPKKQGVRVEFRWTGDRFCHTLLSLHDGQAVPLLKSIEGTPDDRFPPSPALVELHQQDEAIFLTGATEAGHWSMSVEHIFNPPPSQGEARGGSEPPKNPPQFLLFDVACRLRKESGALRSNYQTLTEHTTILGPLATLQQADCQVERDPNSGETHCTPICEPPSKFPTTIRWRYGVLVDSE